MSRLALLRSGKRDFGVAIAVVPPHRVRNRISERGKLHQTWLPRRVREFHARRPVGKKASFVSIRKEPEAEITSNRRGASEALSRGRSSGSRYAPPPSPRHARGAAGDKGMMLWRTGAVIEAGDSQGLGTRTQPWQSNITRSPRPRLRLRPDPARSEPTLTSYKSLIKFYGNAIRFCRPSGRGSIT